MKKAHHRLFCIFLTLLIVLSGCSCNNIIDHDREDSTSQTHETEKTNDVSDGGTIETTTQTAEGDTKIIFSSEWNVAKRTWGIFAINADGFNLQRLVDGADYYSIQDESKIVYALRHESEYEIFIMDADGSNKQFIAVFDEPVGVSGAVISPDGARLAFVLNKEEYPDIDHSENARLYLMQIDGTNKTLLVEKDYAYIGTPSFSPDGYKLMFEVYYDMETFETYTINADGSELRLLPDGYGHTFSLDGSKIIYASGNGVYTIDTDGSNKKCLAKFDEDGYVSNLFIMPDGSKIIFTSGKDDACGLYIMDVDGSNQTRLAEQDAGIYSLSFSPDGAQMLFVSGRDNAASIYIMDIDGSNQTRLAEHDAWIYRLSFSPDGAKILFASTRPGTGRWRLHVMDVDGSNQTLLAENYTRIDSFSFSPDGSMIILYLDADTDGIYIMNADGSNKRFLAEGRPPFLVFKDE